MEGSREPRDASTRGVEEDASTGGPEGPEDPLRRLEERLGRASDAAERLLADAAESAASRLREKPPPAGWASPPAADDVPGAAAARDGELEQLIRLLGSLRELIPPDLQRRLAEALRELLLALRALIDWYLERSERRRGEATEVQDIPIS